MDRESREDECVQSVAIGHDPCGQCRLCCERLQTRVDELESPQIGIVNCPECDYEFDFQVSSRASEES